MKNIRICMFSLYILLSPFTAFVVYKIITLGILYLFGKITNSMDFARFFLTIIFMIVTITVSVVEMHYHDE